MKKSKLVSSTTNGKGIDFAGEVEPVEPEKIPSADQIIGDLVKADNKALHPNLSCLSNDILIMQIFEDTEKEVKKETGEVAKLILPGYVQKSRAQKEAESKVIVGLRPNPIGVVCHVSTDSKHFTKLKSGDKIYYRDMGGDAVHHNGQEYIRIYDNDVIAKIEQS